MAKLPTLPSRGSTFRPIAVALNIALVACSPASSNASLSASKTDSTSSALSADSAGALSATSGPGMCLQPQNKAYTNGTPLVIGPCDGSKEQSWTFTGGTLRLGDSHCVDVKDGADQDGVHLQLWDCVQGNTNQQWKLQDGSFTWVNTNKCIDLSNGQTTAGNLVQIWTCNGNKNQTWVSNNQTAFTNAITTTVGSSSTAPNGAGSGNNSDNNGGYVHTSGQNIVDGSGNVLHLKGTNIGGWLVTENWMDGMTDASDNAGSSSDNSVGRFAKETLESRFGEAQALNLMNVWYDNFFTTQDLDNIKGMGMNLIRVPFGYRNLQHPDGSWVTDGSGNIDFSRLDWIVNEAGNRGIYVILDLHIWQTQRQNYQQISGNNDEGKAAQAQAAAIWTEVTKHFKGNGNIAAFDVLNEPTGSYANVMQIAMYNAVRAQDASRMIVMESMGADPASLGWNNVVYSIHEYGMMGTDFGTNQASFNNDLNGAIRSFHNFNIPVYVGEFMVQESGPTLSWLLNQYNSNNLAWTNWTYKAVNMGSWAFYNLGGNVHVDLQNDSAQTIQSVWSNLGSGSPESTMISAVKGATGG